MPCDAEHSRKLPRLYVFSVHFSEIEFTLGDENNYGEISRSKYCYSGLTLQLSPPSIIVIMTFNTIYEVCK